MERVAQALPQDGPRDPSYVIGFDYGTNSCRAVLMRPDRADELAISVFPYPSGRDGVLYDDKDVHLARQRPADYLLGIEACVADLLEKARTGIEGFEPDQVRGIGFATTGSTVIPVDAALSPLANTQKHRDNLNAQAWLWKDHTSDKEARQISQAFREIRPEMIARCGGIYSPEWFWAKILHLKAVDQAVFDDAHTFLELCEYLPLALSGATADRPHRSLCALGHKALYNADWGGLPDAAFLGSVDPTLASLRERLTGPVTAADTPVGTLTPAYAEKLGLSRDVVLAGGAFDAHIGAVGAGIRTGRLIKVMGTSTCDIMIAPTDREIAGVCGVFKDSVVPGFFGIEAGQSAVGDLFKWFSQQFAPERYGDTDEKKLAGLTAAAARLRPGQSGLVALDWHNGNRSILVDMNINGLIVGQTLQTDAAEVFRALIEATAFGALKIIERFEEAGVTVDDIVCCGGLAQKSPLLMQIYADVTGRPISVAGSQETCAKGAAIFAAAAARLAPLDDLRRDMVSPICTTYQPEPAAHRIYKRLHEVYTALHDAFGRPGGTPDLFDVMKTLNAIRREAHHG